MQKTQNKIKNVVKLYKETFPEEYKTVCEGIEMSRRLQKDEFGSTQDGSNFVGRIYHDRRSGQEVQGFQIFHDL